jgi:hypothetical protein
VEQLSIFGIDFWCRIGTLIGTSIGLNAKCAEVLPSFPSDASNSEIWKLKYASRKGLVLLDNTTETILSN